MGEWENGRMGEWRNGCGIIMSVRVCMGDGSECDVCMYVWTDHLYTLSNTYVLMYVHMWM